MEALLLSVSLISFFHALIPSHWLPITVIAKNARWSNGLTLRATFYLGLAHVLSTAILCFGISFLGEALFDTFNNKFDVLTGAFLIVYGVFFIYRHYKHHHFHYSADAITNNGAFKKIILQLLVLMFFSPCLEVVAIFFNAGKFGFVSVALLAVVYAVISISGMMIWVSLVQHGLKKINWHRIEHNAGLLTGGVLVIMGVLQCFGIGF